MYRDLRYQFGDLEEVTNVVKFSRAITNRRDILKEENRKRHLKTIASAANPAHGTRDRIHTPIWGLAIYQIETFFLNLPIVSKAHH